MLSTAAMQRQLLEEVAAGLAHYLEQGRREAGWLGPQDSRPAVRFSRKDRVQSLFGAAAAASGALSAAGAGPAGTRAPWADRDAEGQTRCESLQQDLLAAAWKQWAEQEQKRQCQGPKGLRPWSTSVRIRSFGELLSENDPWFKAHRKARVEAIEQSRQRHRRAQAEEDARREKSHVPPSRASSAKGVFELAADAIVALEGTLAKRSAVRQIMRRPKTAAAAGAEAKKAGSSHSGSPTASLGQTPTRPQTACTSSLGQKTQTLLEEPEADDADGAGLQVAYPGSVLPEQVLAAVKELAASLHQRAVEAAAAAVPLVEQAKREGERPARRDADLEVVLQREANRRRQLQEMASASARQHEPSSSPNAPHVSVGAAQLAAAVEALTLRSRALANKTSAAGPSSPASLPAATAAFAAQSMSGMDKARNSPFPGNKDGQAAIHDASSSIFAAVRSGDLDAVKDNLQRSPEAVGELDSMGRTALMMAAGKGMLDIVEMLLEHEAEPGVINKQGHQALHFAAAGNHSQCVEALLRAGARPNARTLDGVTALHFAAREGAIASAVSLLEAGARVDAMDEQGATPLSLAVQSKREAMVALLRQSRT